MNIGICAIIKNLRIENGLTMKKLAQMVGVTEGSISRYENGERTPDFSTFDKICKVLGSNANDELKKQNYINSLETMYTYISQIKDSVFADIDNIESIIYPNLNFFQKSISQKDLEIIVIALSLLDDFKNYSESIEENDNEMEYLYKKNIESQINNFLNVSENNSIRISKKDN